jgi:hypothetical protein
MARHVRSRMGWDERNGNRIGHGTGLLGTVRSILRLNHRADTSASCIIHGGIEGSEAYHGFTTVREAEVSLRRVQMLQ